MSGFAKQPILSVKVAVVEEVAGTSFVGDKHQAPDTPLQPSKGITPALEEEHSNGVTFRFVLVKSGPAGSPETSSSWQGALMLSAACASLEVVEYEPECSAHWPSGPKLG